MTVITDAIPDTITGYSTRAERIAARPANYAELSPLHKWQVDDDLGIFEEEPTHEHHKHKHHRHKE